MFFLSGKRIHPSGTEKVFTALARIALGRAELPYFL